MLNLMLGSSYTEQQNDEFSALVLDFSIKVKKIFECSAALMSLPPAQADKWNLKIWKDFEQVAMQSIELCKLISRFDCQLFFFFYKYLFNDVSKATN